MKRFIFFASLIYIVHAQSAQEYADIELRQEVYTGSLISIETMVGEWEGVLQSSSLEKIGVPTYVVNYQFFSDHSLLYKEYIDAESAEGIPGTEEGPPCSGVWSYERGHLTISLDCSRYSSIIRQDINLGELGLNQLTTSFLAILNSDNLPYPVTMSFKKILPTESRNTGLVLQYNEATQVALVNEGYFKSYEFVEDKIIVYDLNSTVGFSILDSVDFPVSSFCFLGSIRSAQSLVEHMIHNMNGDGESEVLEYSLTSVNEFELDIEILVRDSSQQEYAYINQIKSCSFN